MWKLHTVCFYKMTTNCESVTFYFFVTFSKFPISRKKKIQCHMSSLNQLNYIRKSTPFFPKNISKQAALTARHEVLLALIKNP